MGTATKYVRLGAGAPKSEKSGFEEDFKTVAKIMYETAGVNLTDKKKQLVQSRLTRRFRELGMASLSDYVKLVSSPAGSKELSSMVDALTTNKTFFFREPAHFEYLVDTFLPDLKDKRQIKIWSAGCSSGEEAYTLAMVLEDALGRSTQSYKILATDICTTVLATAKKGIYPADAVDGIPEGFRKRFLRNATVPETGKPGVEVVPELRRKVSVARLNLMGQWPMKGPFDAIFCRNVMIYFDKKTRQNLVRRYWNLLAPGGTLFIGHSETLGTEDLGYRFVQPAVYRK